MAGETATRAPLYVNKHAFKEYLESFPEGKETTAVKKAKKTKNLQLWLCCLVTVRFRHTQSQTDYNTEIHQKINSLKSHHLHQIKDHFCFLRVGVFVCSYLAELLITVLKSLTYETNQVLNLSLASADLTICQMNFWLLQHLNMQGQLTNLRHKPLNFNVLFKVLFYFSVI